MRSSKLVVLFILTFFLLLGLKLPASLLVNQVSLPSGVAYQGLTGTIWQGQIEKLQLNNLLLQKLSWRFDVTSLLSAQLGMAIKFGQARNSSELSGKGVVTVGLDGIGLEKATVRVPADIVKTMLPIPVGELGGRFIATVDSYQKGQLLCNELTGELVWTKAQVDFGGPVDLGAIGSTLTCLEQAVVAQFDGENKLGLEGQVNVQSVNKYNFDGYLKPDADLPKAIHDGLRMFGKADAKGKYKITL